MAPMETRVSARNAAAIRSVCHLISSPPIDWLLFNSESRPKRPITRVTVINCLFCVSYKLHGRPIEPALGPAPVIFRLHASHRPPNGGSLAAALETIDWSASALASLFRQRAAHAAAQVGASILIEGLERGGEICFTVRGRNDN